MVSVLSEVSGREQLTGWRFNGGRSHQAKQTGRICRSTWGLVREVNQDVRELLALANSLRFGTCCYGMRHKVSCDCQRGQTRIL